MNLLVTCLVVPITSILFWRLFLDLPFKKVFFFVAAHGMIVFISNSAGVEYNKFKDALFYFERALVIFESEYLFSFDVFEMALVLGGQNFLFLIISAISFHIFGPFLSSPPLLFLFVSPLFFYFFKLVWESIFGVKKFSYAPYVLFFLYPEIWVFTTIQSLRDGWIFGIGVVYLALMQSAIQRFSFSIVVHLFCVISLMFVLRTHVAYIFFVLSFLGLVFFIDKIPIVIKIIILAVSITFFLVYLREYIFIWWDSFHVVGILKILLSPVNNIFSGGYAFAVVTSFFVLIGIPFYAYGVLYSFVNVGRGDRHLSKFMFFVAIFSICCIILLGGFDNIGGPRQRLNISFSYFILMFYGLSKYLSKCN